MRRTAAGSARLARHPEWRHILLLQNNTFSSWQVPQGLMGARLFKVSARLDFGPERCRVVQPASSSTHGLSGTNYATSGDGKPLAVAPVPNGWDRLALLFDWVERGVAPGMSITVTAGDEEPAAVLVSHVSEIRGRTRDLGVVVPMQPALMNVRIQR